MTQNVLKPAQFFLEINKQEIKNKTLVHWFLHSKKYDKLGSILKSINL